MSPWPSSCSAPCSPRMVRLSIFEVTWNEMRVGKFALMVPVMTSTDGRCVARMTWMPAGRALGRGRGRHLPPGRGRALGVLAGHHPQVRHFVDDDDDVGDVVELEVLLLVDRL